MLEKITSSVTGELITVGEQQGDWFFKGKEIRRLRCY